MNNLISPETGTPQFAILDNIGNPISGWGVWNTIKKLALTAGNRYKVAAKVTNKVGLETKLQSDEFIYDNSAPQNLSITGPSETTFAPGEQVVFTVTASEPESAITQYQLTMASDIHGNPALTSLVPGNDHGCLDINSSATSVQFRFEIPQGASGSYHPVLQVKNAAGLANTYVGTSYIIDSTVEKLMVSDQGPYTQFGDHLIGWWKYIGSKNVTGYQSRIINVSNQVVSDWSTTNDISATIFRVNSPVRQTIFLPSTSQFR